MTINKSYSKEEYIINHVFMPQRLPQEAEQDDEGGFGLDHELAMAILDCANEYKNTLTIDEGDLQSWAITIDMLQAISEMHKAQPYSADNVVARFGVMQSGSITAILVRKQNAGLIIRQLSDIVVFEAFEASPPPDIVLAATGKVIVTFPGPCVSIPLHVFQDPFFRSELASFLAQMNVDRLDESMAHTEKAGSKVQEVRYPADPRMITDLLMKILAAVESKEIVSAMKIVTKRLGDDVLWMDAYEPWRRSSLWLVIRVALQTSLAPVEYKRFMLYAVASISKRTTSLSNDFLEAMRAKLSRRMVKLNDAPPILVNFVREACQNIHDVMLRRWKKWHAEAQDISPLLDLTLKDVVADTRLELAGCFEYINWSSRSALHITSSSYTPTHKPRCNEWSFSQTLEHKLDYAFGEDVAIGLHDFEEQVARNLGVGSREFNDIQALLENLKAYFAIADKYYDENPEDQSIMLLTIFEMWRAIDKVAIKEIPLLGEYLPEVSYQLIENLLLRKAKDLKRAMDLIKYLKTREHNARPGYPSVFGTVEWTSFSIRYYDSESSRVMQDLMTSIDQHATTMEQRKADEREEKIRDRDRLERLAREASHTYSNNYDHRWWNCNKCRWENDAKNITIGVYEWPLPRHHNHDQHRKNIVFELCCPEYFSQWREATILILFDILTPLHARFGDDTESQHTLMSYYTQDRMGHTPISNLGSRITLASRTKSFGDSHYRSVHIQDCHSLTTAIVNHGMTWELFDTSTKLFITQQYHAADTLWRCTYTIPGDEKKLYGALAFTLCTTAHTENEVLAKQEKCAQGITLHEFVAYGCLRSGKHIQWQNILRAIATRSLTFRHEAVHALIAHAVQQIGGATVEGNSLERHLDLMSEAFCKRLLEVVGALVEDISGNWKELRTLRTVVLLLLRVLANPANPAICEEADGLLRLARTIAFRWLKETLARSDSDSHGSNAMVSHICEIALTLRLTYDVVDQLMSTEDKCVFVFCGIVIHDRSPSKRDTSHKPTRVLVDRSQRLSCLYEEQLLASFASLDSDAFDQAVVLVWPPFQRVSEPWTRLDGNNKRWISCHTTTGGQLVQLNILDGRLLVDGKPIGLLPKSITQHVTYRRLFENVTLRVIPAGISGWEYKTVQPVGVWEIFFALRGENLAIRSRNTCTGTFTEHIPCEKLTADLPTPFVEDYVHWMDTTTQSVDLRLLDNMWGVQAKWCINLDTHVMSLQQVPTPQRLIEPRSLTFQYLLSQHLRRLEHPSFVIAVLHSDQYIRVSLPRFKLEFSVNVGGTPGPLKCETFSGMVVDRDQSIPTWHGLQTKLVLKEPVTSNELLSPRRFLLVPNGSIAYNTDALRSHVNVTIDTDPSHSRHVQYFRYEVDSALCLLRCSGSLESQLYKSYLHALTSNGIPDTLTGRTGVEEALSVINSATCQSFMRLSHRDIELLNSIRKLTPVRHYYPPRREVMQTIDWLDLPASSQRAAYACRVDALVAYDRELALFSDAPPNLLAVNSPVHLLNRAGARESLFPLINILNACTTPYPEDKHHNQADSTTIQSDCSAYATARMVCSDLMVGTFMPVGTRSAALNLYPSFFEKWENMTTGHAETAQLSYSRVWLSRTDFGATWLSLYQSCCSDTLPLKQKTFKLLFSLPAFAITLASSESFDLAPCLMAFASHPSVFTRIPVPVHATYELSFGTEPSQARIARIVQNQQHPLSETPSHSLPQHWNEEPRNHYDRRHSHYNDECATLNREITERLVRAWHQRTWCGSICPGSAAGYFNINVIDREARLLFDHCLHNRELRDYADRVEDALKTLHLPSPVTYHTDDHVLSMRLGSPAHHTEMQSRVPVEYSAPTLDELVSRREPPCIIIPLVSKTIGTPSPNPMYYSSEGALMLRDLLTSFCEQFDSGLEYMYGSGVRKSLDNIESSGRSLPGHVDMVGGSGLDSPFLKAAVGAYYTACRHQFKAQLLEVEAALEPRFHWEHVIDVAGLWPLRDIRTILAQLRQKRWRVLNVEWKHVLIHLAHSLLCYQQCERIIRFTANSMIVDLEKELKTSCDVDIEFSMQHPDDLLIQIENNFLAREVQKTITAEMLEPSDRPNMENVLYQLNMGEGKSTVIVPMVATSIADGQRLARIVVLKPLVKQMFQLLTQRVSEFPNRRVCYFPFSRQMKMGREQFQRIRRLYEECMEDGAILIALPEHILSAKLLSIDRVLAGPSSTDRGPMEEALGFQRWQKKHSRDILDESDELLHIRYQLIYTVGAQKVLEPAPARWKIVQEVLACFAKHVLPLSDELNDPSVLQVNSSDVWAFPSVKLPQRHQISSSIVGVILDDIMEGHLQSIIIPASQSLKDAIRRYLTTVDDDECQDAREELDRQLGNDATFQMVLVLRGLLLHGLLIYALRDRRWRVDYGLDLSRSMLAVPFRAKDVPSPRAEFGHPDIAVLLTCLSYYYGGLTHDQIDTCVKHLLSQSSPQLHYDIWIEDVPREHLSSDLIDPAGINSDDPEQCSRVYALFQYNRNVINFYLNNVVFPRCAKQFEHKLPCSAWDLAEKKNNITTGFSGTNDNRYLLPTSTRQAELAAQAGTSALVLTHLLHPANTAYVCAAGADGTTLSGSALISTVASYPEIRVLLDVGAQILDLSNKAVARKWLECTSHEAAIFFDGDDELMAITKEGAWQPLQSSPYRDESGIAKCVVYLDDAHTRGTDLRLPRHWRAAVTLGKKVTKDRLAQGCMRMRQFGNGQTITFFAPPDIDITVRAAAGKQHHQDVEVVDVVRWAMLETCADIRHHTASWAQQGIDHHARSQALDSLPDSPSEDDVVPVRNVWLRPEARTLKEMYYLKPTLDLGDEVPKEITDRLNEIGLQTPTRADMDEEQEREVTHEIEEERQQEAPPPATAAIPKFTPALLTLVKNRSLALSSFRCLGDVLAVIPSWKADHSSSNNIFSPQLLVTPDFENTILSAQRADLMKPVQWILATTTLSSNCLILVSQFEANRLISMLKKLGSTHAQLHMYCPRVAKTMPVFDNLMFHSIPSTFQGDASLDDLILQVNIFAGQLYPTSWADFNRLCDFLGIANDPDRHPIAMNDRFVLPVNRDVRMAAACRFNVSPIRFLKDLVALRRKGQEFELTPIGRLLAGHRLFEEDFL